MSNSVFTAVKCHISYSSQSDYPLKKLVFSKSVDHLTIEIHPVPDICDTSELTENYHHWLEQSSIWLLIDRLLNKINIQGLKFWSNLLFVILFYCTWAFPIYFCIKIFLKYLFMSLGDFGRNRPINVGPSKVAIVRSSLLLSDLSESSDPNNHLKKVRMTLKIIWGVIIYDCQ